MAWEFLGSGGVINAGEIGNYVSQIPAGNYARLSFDLRASPAGWMVDQIRNILVNAGVPGVQVSTGSPVLNVDWLIEEPVTGIAMEPLTAIAIILSAIAVILLLVIGWSVWNSIPGSIKGVTATILFVGGGLLLLAYALSKFKGGQKYGTTTS